VYRGPSHPGGWGGGCRVIIDPFTAGGPGRGGGGSGVCQSVSGAGNIGGFGFAVDGGGNVVHGDGSGLGGTSSYGTQVCQYSFHMCSLSGLIIGCAVYGG
jgi:hypothetical protein